MGRPPLPVGVHVRIDFHHARSGRVRARTRVRGADGMLWAVTRWGSDDAEGGAMVRVAMHYYAAYPEEIDAEIAEADRVSGDAERAWRIERRLLA